MTSSDADAAAPLWLALECKLFTEASFELTNCEFEELYEDTREVGEALKRIRRQLRAILDSLRQWRLEHDRLQHRLRRRYSLYEGFLIRDDLRRHWQYYFLAQRHYHRLRRECDNLSDHMSQVVEQRRPTLRRDTDQAA